MWEIILKEFVTGLTFKKPILLILFTSKPRKQRFPEKQPAALGVLVSWCLEVTATVFDTQGDFQSM